eukprot:TRINITY_DN1808_c0_g1_i1.p1 TRINITY_DN1808_c0_g1~~TRINITY_DN1808_c0_g1_i1.p1  ORF type:complete len:680 (+),score=-10.13 TRINITY_DN1808_c0_g1_i1:259-2298(+)
MGSGNQKQASVSTGRSSSLQKMNTQQPAVCTARLSKNEKVVEVAARHDTFTAAAPTHTSLLSLSTDVLEVVSDWCGADATEALSQSCSTFYDTLQWRFLCLGEKKPWSFVRALLDSTPQHRRDAMIQNVRWIGIHDGELFHEPGDQLEFVQRFKNVKPTFVGVHVHHTVELQPCFIRFVLTLWSVQNLFLDLSWAKTDTILPLFTNFPPHLHSMQLNLENCRGDFSPDGFTTLVSTLLHDNTRTSQRQLHQFGLNVNHCTINRNDLRSGLSRLSLAAPTLRTLDLKVPAEPLLPHKPSSPSLNNRPIENMGIGMDSMGGMGMMDDVRTGTDIWVVGNTNTGNQTQNSRPSTASSNNSSSSGPTSSAFVIHVDDRPKGKQQQPRNTGRPRHDPCGIGLDTCGTPTTRDPHQPLEKILPSLGSLSNLVSLTLACGDGMLCIPTFPTLVSLHKLQHLEITCSVNPTTDRAGDVTPLLPSGVKTVSLLFTDSYMWDCPSAKRIFASLFWGLTCIKSLKIDISGTCPESLPWSEAPLTPPETLQSFHFSCSIMGNLSAMCFALHECPEIEDVRLSLGPNEAAGPPKNGRQLAAEIAQIHSLRRLCLSLHWNAQLTQEAELRSFMSGLTDQCSSLQEVRMELFMTYVKWKRGDTCVGLRSGRSDVRSWAREADWIENYNWATPDW